MVTRMYESPISTRQRLTSRFHGDKFLRFTPEESSLIARTEAVHGYNPYISETRSVLASQARPEPPDTGRLVAVGSFSWRKYLLRRFAAVLLEWAED